MKKIQLSLVVPFYNESHIAQNTEILLKFFKINHISGELILVNDGSTLAVDPSFLKRISKHKNITYLRYLPNRGRGYAIRFGFNKARGENIGYIDADLEIAPKYIRDCLKMLEKYDGVVVSKYHPKSQVDTTLLRKSASIFLNYWIKLVLNSKVRDHQAGLKLFNRKALKRVLPYLKSEGWLLDIELLYLLQKKNISIAEVPLSIRYGHTKIRKSFISGFFKVVFFAMILKLRKY